MPYMTKPVPSPYPVTTTTPMDDDYVPLGHCGGYSGPCVSPSASLASPHPSATPTIVVSTRPSPPATLPVTGPDPTAVMALAGSLLALGLFFIVAYVVARRRRRLM